MTEIKNLILMALRQDKECCLESLVWQGECQCITSYPEIDEKTFCYPLIALNHWEKIKWDYYETVDNKIFSSV